MSNFFLIAVLKKKKASQREMLIKDTLKAFLKLSQVIKIVCEYWYQELRSAYLSILVWFESALKKNNYENKVSDWARLMNNSQDNHFYYLNCYP